MELELLTRLATLSHPQRMAIFRLLIRRYPDALAVGEILSVLNIKPSTASVYLSALKSAGLINQSRVGNSLQYSANIHASQEIITDLFKDCCGNRADLCVPTPSQYQIPKVLFVCTGNSARSIMAEALMRDIGKGRFEAHSAGTTPRTSVHPTALKILNRVGHETASLKPKTISELSEHQEREYNFVFTVCDSAANIEYGSFSGAPITSHWSTKDPVTHLDNSEDFEHAYDLLRTRITRFANLPFGTSNRTELQQMVDGIANK